MVPPQENLAAINEDTTKGGGDAVTIAPPAAAEQANRTSRRASMVASSFLAWSSLFKQNEREQAIAQAFDSIDMDKSGKLDEQELFIFLAEAARHAKLEVEEDVIHAAVRHLIEQQQHEAEEGREEGLKKSISEKFISRDMFYAMFERNPELYRVFDSVEERSRRSNRCFSLLKKDEEAVEYLKESHENSSQHQLWKVAKLGWKRKRLVVFWLLLYVAATITVFTKIAISYARKEEFTEVFGNCIVVARASAKTMNLNAALILLPISRHFITALRHVKLPFPFDISLDIHMLIGTSFAIFAFSHVMAHVCDYERMVNHADHEDLEALFGDKLGGPIPTSKIGRLGLMMKQRATITGIIMVICLVLAYSSIRSRRQNFNRFWYLHHLLLIMLIMMCIHGTGNLFEAHQSIYWICCPLALYIFPRLYREISRRKVKLLSARAIGDILDIQLEKPAAWEKTQRAGMYALINIPEISKAEWHPFTLCSSPADDHIRFSIRNAGDWTNKLYKMVMIDEAAESSTSKEDNGSVTSMEEAVTSAVGRVQSKRVNLRDLVNPIIRVEGPFGASSQGFSEYPIVVLVGAGIGVTPMISVINMLSKRPGKMVRAFFYWTVRDRSSFALYSHLMEEIYEKDDENKISIRYFLTSAKRDGRHLGSVLLSHAARCIHAQTHEDIISGHKSHQPVEIGRPDWDKELQDVIEVAKELGQKQVGIFLCGPDGLADEVQSNSRRLNGKEKDMYLHFAKETF